MRKTKAPLEILAPAKDKQTAISAIEYGADAIYIGAPNFGARKNASNSLKDIKEVVNYAHKFFAKVYVTLNTILTDEELKPAQELIFELYNIGVDAIIVQDFSIFAMDLPPINIFASTQCDIRDVDKVQFFEQLGLKRVILARELSLEQIKEICENSKVEIETFVHGALCVSYSGQCYLSCALGGRSANRGECAQPCRKKYTLFDEKGNIYAKNAHLLCLKDFCAINELEDLIKCGVTSFKIEGRLKDENYVKNVVGAYNLALQNHKRSSVGKVFYDFTPDVKKTFNRGFCTYCLKDDDRKIFNFDTSKSLGEFLGTISNVTKKYFDIKTKIKINSQDGLFVPNFGGVLVNRTEDFGSTKRVYALKIPDFKIGDKIWRNFDFEFDKMLKNSKTKRQIPVRISVFENKIEMRDINDIKVVKSFDELELANDTNKAKENYKTQFSKCGGSDFYLENIEFKTEKLPFLRISQINNLRREMFEELIQKRLEAYDQKKNRKLPGKITPTLFPSLNNDYRLNIHNKKALEFYRQCGVEPKQMSFEKSFEKNA